MTADLRIAIYVFEGVSTFHMSVPQLVFGEVERACGVRWSTTLWSTTSSHVQMAEGYQIGPVAGREALTDADIVVIPSWPEDLPTIDDELRADLTAAHARGAMVVGLCLGSIAVVDTGLLDGRSAVTHWAAMEVLSDRHPDVRAESSVLYVDHGDVLTAAGTASALDACLHIVRSRLGADVANRVARRLVVAPHRDGGQAQYVERPLPTESGSDPVGVVCDEILGDLAHPWTVDAMASQASMSRRHFIRKFVEKHGIPPARWVTLQRLDHARGLLEQTDLDIERIAADCGFASSVTLRQNFAAHFTTTPSAYRRRFRHT